MNRNGYCRLPLKRLTATRHIVLYNEYELRNKENGRFTDLRKVNYT